MERCASGRCDGFSAPKRLGALVLLVFLSLSGCDMPRDPQSTLDRVRGATLRVGVVNNPPWVTIDKGEVSGIEPELLEALASSLGSELQWVQGPEHELMTSLEHVELHAVVAGLTRDNPWRDKVAVSIPYYTAHEKGEPQRHIFALPPGENRWLVTVEQFLQARKDQIRTGLDTRLYEDKEAGS